MSPNEKGSSAWRNCSSSHGCWAETGRTALSTGGDSTPGSVVTPDERGRRSGEGRRARRLGRRRSIGDREGGLGRGLGRPRPRSERPSTRLNHAAAALTNTIVGAGIVALPTRLSRAWAWSLGARAPGGAFFFLSRYTLAAMIRSASAVGVWTYDELVRSQFGDWGARSLDAAIVVNNSGRAARVL